MRTNVKPERLGQSGVGQSPYHTAVIDHDKKGHTP
jgi:hypothetical protein